MPQIQAKVTEDRLFEVELPCGRQLIDIDGYELAHLSESYRCPVEVIFPGPRALYIPMKQINVQT